MKRPVVVVLVLITTALAMPGLALTGCGDTSGTHATVDISVNPTVETNSDPTPPWDSGPTWDSGPAWDSGLAWSASTSATTSTDTTITTDTASTDTTTVTSLPKDEVARAKLRITRYEEDRPGLTWIGVWTFTGNAKDSEGNSRYSESTGSSVTVEFTGVSLVLITRTARNLGQVKITVDDGWPVIVDCYSPRPRYQQVLWATDPLEPGRHIVKIECAGTADAASIGKGVYIDAFVVAETPGLVPEETTDETPDETSEETPDEVEE